VPQARLYHASNFDMNEPLLTELSGMTL